MRISEAQSATRDIVVHFEGGDLNVTYRPVSYTINETEKMAEDTSNLDKASPAERAEKMGKFVDSIARLVIAWDLEDEEGITIDPSDRAALRDVPLNILNDVVSTISKDQRPSGEASRD